MANIATLWGLRPTVRHQQRAWESDPGWAREGCQVKDSPVGGRPRTLARSDRNQFEPLARETPLRANGFELLGANPEPRVYQAAICVRRSLTSPIRRPLRHWLVVALSSRSAMFSNLPCYGV